MDVTDADACADEIGRFELYGLVNNAGYTNSGAVEDASDADVRHQIETMTVAPTRLARLAQPLMGNPRQVARVIAHTISTRMPRARYLVGTDARVLALIEQTTPTFLKDAVTPLGLGL